MKTLWLKTAGVLSALSVCGAAQAATILYGNNASSAGDYVEKFDATTGALLQTYNPSSGNGRGVVVVGNVVYSTVVGDPRIYKTDATTGAPLGSILTAAASMSTIAWDGSHFWTSDYTGSNQGFRIDPNTGAIVKTVSFSLATGFMDGMEYFNGKLIVNRTDGGFGGPITYDIYDTDGNLLTPSFITAPNGTGIAYDGTDFFVSDIYSSQVNVYDGTTGAFLRTVTLAGSPPDGSRLIEDLSVDYAQRPDTRVPDAGGTLAQLGLVCLLGLGAVRRLRLA